MENISKENNYFLFDYDLDYDKIFDKFHIDAYSADKQMKMYLDLYKDDFERLIDGNYKFKDLNKGKEIIKKLMNNFEWISECKKYIRIFFVEKILDY